MADTFDVKSLPLHRQITLGGGLLFFVVLFFPWVSYDVEGLVSGSASGWNGIGTVAGLLVILLVIWEVLRVFGQVSQITVKHDLVTAGLAGLVALFGLIQFLRSLTYNSEFAGPGFGAFLILIFSVGLGYAAFLAFKAGDGQAALKAAQEKRQADSGDDGDTTAQ